MHAMFSMRVNNNFAIYNDLCSDFLLNVRKLKEISTRLRNLFMGNYSGFLLASMKSVMRST